MHEAQTHQKTCFITLTYDDQHLKGPSLDYEDFKRFMKRLRRWHEYTYKKPDEPYTGIRYLTAGEYGTKFDRPHFHAALFGDDFRHDRTKLKKRLGKFDLYRSERLEKLWPHGYSSVGELTWESAAYIARYVMKKITGDKAIKHYEIIDPDTGEITTKKPEMLHMSTRPAIGKKWYEKYHTDVYPHDRVVTNGVPTKPPKYYDKLFGRKDKEKLEEIKKARVDRAVARGDNSEKRLAVKEEVLKAKLNKLKRTLT